MRSLRWSWPIWAVAMLVAVPWIVYVLRAEQPLKVVVLDKTVPYETRKEHRSLFWLLGHLKVVQPDGAPYDPSKDYVGAFPGAEPGDPPARTVDLTTEVAMQADLIYLADTYGVYTGDLASKASMKEALERSRRIYGGLTVQEANAVVAAAESGKTVVAEFNTLGSPTSPEARETLESLLGIRWTRWIGRFFPRLEDESEVPEWMRKNYEREWRQNWDFTGPGYVLLQDDVHCEVLRVGQEAEQLGLRIEKENKAEPLLRGAREATVYPYWFDIVVTQPGTQTLARFEWNLTPAGYERLRARGLPTSFPAVTYRQAANQGKTFYFAGDFADNPMRSRAVPLAGYMTFRRWMESGFLATSRQAFYWRFYAPMVANILNSAADERATAVALGRLNAHEPVGP
ncbi:MAG: hypothetical protein AB1714_02865 [Acidobacteriota bacterium]